MFASAVWALTTLEHAMMERHVIDDLLHGTVQDKVKFQFLFIFAAGMSMHSGTNTLARSPNGGELPTDDLPQSAVRSVAMRIWALTV